MSASVGEEEEEVFARPAPPVGQKRAASRPEITCEPYIRSWVVPPNPMHMASVLDRTPEEAEHIFNLYGMTLRVVKRDGVHVPRPAVEMHTSLMRIGVELQRGVVARVVMPIHAYGEEFIAKEN